MSDINHYSPIDFNKLAAYLDGNLPSDEMTSLESYISSDVRLSAMMDEISELDNQIIDNCILEDVISDLQFLDIELPLIENLHVNEDFFNSTDSYDGFLSSLLMDNLSSPDESIDNNMDFSNDSPDDLIDDNTLDDF